MDLHRADKVPDWNKIPEESRNPWQRLASKTHGWLTPGNLVTTAGNILTFKGIAEVAKGNTSIGLASAGIGRIADIVDGKVAKRTGTRSPLGEALDASLDKLQMAAALSVLIESDIVPKIPGILIAAEQASIAGLGIIAKKRGNELHPSAVGKLATGVSWTAFASFTAAKAISDSSEHSSIANIASRGFEISAYAAAATSVALGGLAIRDYVKNTFVPRSTELYEETYILVNQRLDVDQDPSNE